MKRPIQRITPFLIVALTVAVYWQGLDGGFIFDDFVNLVSDPNWKVTSLSFVEWRRAVGFGIASDLGRPLALLSFAVNHYFTGIDAFPLKLTGLAFHLLNSALVYCLCRRLFALRSVQAGGARLGDFAAAVVTAAWTLHPLQVSSVLYVVQRMEVGAHTGVLLALLCYLRARDHQIRGLRAWPWFLLAGAATLAGLGFKETAILVPGYALAIEACLLGFRGRNQGRSIPLVATYSAGLIASLALYFTVVLPRYARAEVYAFREFDLAERLLAQIDVLAMYLGQMALPLPNKLLFYYDNLPIPDSLTAGATPYHLLLLIGLAVMALIARTRLPLVSLGICWFFIAHALTSNVVPLELAFEHRNYFALLGILIAAAQALAWIFRRTDPAVARLAALAPVALLAFVCTIQTHTWADPFRLATILESRNPGSPRASYDLGLEMLRLSRNEPESPLYSLARKQFEHSSRLLPPSPLPEQALIYMAATSGAPSPASAWSSFREKLSRRPAGSQEFAALEGVSGCRIQHTCALDDQELLDTYIVAIHHNPDSHRVLSLYANFAYNVLDDAPLAIRLTRECIRLMPGEIAYKVNLARLLAATGEHPAELQQLTDYIRDNDSHQRYQQELARGFQLEQLPQDL